MFSEEEKETPGVDAFVFLLRVFGVTTYSIIVCTFLLSRASCCPSYEGKCFEFLPEVVVDFSRLFKTYVI